jgi:hypothetical protein
MRSTYTSRLLSVLIALAAPRSLMDSQSDVIDDHGSSDAVFCLVERIIWVQRNTANVRPDSL